MVNIEKVGNVDVITFSVSKINALITDEIRQRVTGLFERPNTKVVIDLKGVEYIDSSGFSCLLSCFRVSKNNYGMIKISNPEPAVKTLFEMLHLHTVFEICSDTEECIRSYR